MSDIHEIRQKAESLLDIPHKLHDYQWEGVSFLYRSSAALLADEMGLGKTVQASIALALLMEEESEIERAVIVAPASLVTNWVMELATWAPSLTVRQVRGSQFVRGTFYLLPVPVLVCSYEQIRADGLDHIPMDTFDLVILDEAQRIKNKNSTTALACRLLPRKWAWALSATPLENDVSDVESILDFLRPEVDQQNNEVCDNQLKSIMLRRLKSDVRSELPPVIVRDLKLDLHAPQRRKYDDLWVNRLATIQDEVNRQDINMALLGLLTRLKIVCNYDSETDMSSKLDVLMDIFEKAGQSARIIIFSQFVETLQWLSKKIPMQHNLVIGSMSQVDRQAAMKKFRTGTAPQVLLVSLRAGGVGLNLGEASHVVLFDRWWNPAVEIQAIYRAHRFQRKTPLLVFRFLALDTVEERIATILKRKQELSDKIVGPNELITSSSKTDELLEILEITAPDITTQLNNEPREDQHHG